MAEEKRYPRSGRRSILDYSTFVANKDDFQLVCVSRSVLDLARVLVEQRGRWKTTYALSYSNSGYVAIGDIELDLVEEKIAEFLEATGAMNCDDFLEALSAIGDAISAKGSSDNCGCGSGSAGGSSPPADDTILGPPGEQLGEPPDGFSTWAEYENYKCDMAAYVLSVASADLSWWANVDIVALTATGLAASLFTPVPFDDVLLLVGLLLALSLQGVAAAAISVGSDVLANSNDEILCALYEASDAGSAKTDVDNAIDTGVDVETTAIWAGIVKSLLKGLFNQHVINKLFVRDGPLADGGMLPTGNCSGCASGCQAFFVDDGTLIAVNGNVITVQSSVQGTGVGIRQQATVRVNYDGAYCSTSGRTADITSLQGHVPHPEPNIPEFTVNDQSGVELHDGAAQWAAGFCGARFFIRGDDASVFTVDLDIGENCAI